MLIKNLEGRFFVAENCIVVQGCYFVIFSGICYWYLLFRHKKTTRGKENEEENRPD